MFIPLRCTGALPTGYNLMWKHHDWSGCMIYTVGCSISSVSIVSGKTKRSSAKKFGGMVAVSEEVL